MRWWAGCLRDERKGKGRGGPVTEWVVDERSRMEGGVIQAYVGSSEDRESWVFISAYGPGSEKSEKEIEEFYNELSECVGSFGRNKLVVVLGDLNARVGNQVIEGIVGRHAGRNESGERLLKMCAEQELVLGNSWLKKRCV